MFSIRKFFGDFKRKVKYDNSDESFININNIWFDPIDEEFVYLIIYTEDRAQEVIDFISGFGIVNSIPSIKWVLGNGGYTTEGKVHEGGKSEIIYHNRYYLLFRFNKIDEIVSYIKSLDNEVLDKIIDDYCNRIHYSDVHLSDIVKDSGIFINRRFIGVPLNYNTLMNDQSNLNYLLERSPKCFTVYDIIQVACKKISDNACAGLYSLPSEEIQKYYPNFDSSLLELPPIFYLNNDDDDDIKGYLSDEDIDTFFTDDIYRFNPLDLQEIKIDEIIEDDSEGVDVL